MQHKNRLPLHLPYRFDTPRVYEVRYTSLGLAYWPGDEIDRSLTELLHTRDPSDVVVERTFRTPGAVDFTLPYLRSDNPVLIHGAVTSATRLVFADPQLLSAESRVRTENASIATAENVLRADPASPSSCRPSSRTNSTGARWCSLSRTVFPELYGADDSNILAFLKARQ